MIEGNQKLMTKFFKQQLNFCEWHKNNSVIGSMVEIEPLLIGWLQIFEQHPKHFLIEIKKIQLLDLVIENFQSLAMCIENGNFPQLNMW